MKFVDCIWEIDNLGKRTCEISYDDKDIYDKNILLDLIQDFEYIVVKVPMNHPEINLSMADLGFTMIETQLNISKRYKDFDFEDRLIKHLYPHVSEMIISTEKEFNEIVGRITSDMFSTDRISLDPYFGHDSSCKRYVNWMKTEFRKNTTIKKILFDEKEIGFGMSRIIDGIEHGLLGGIYECEQSEGYGLLTACSGFITAKKNNNPIKKVHTAISSNNVPMLQIYNYLNFKIDNMTYVYIKHKI